MEPMSLDHYEGAALDTLVELAKANHQDESTRLQAAQVILQHVQYKGHLECYHRAKIDVSDKIGVLFGSLPEGVVGGHPNAD
jgi:hypothetical protein